MKSFDARQTEGITLAFDGRQLAATALFASAETARPILSAVAVVFDPKAKTDAHGRISPVGFVATDSYQLGLTGSGSPSQVRESLADDAMSYVLIERADILKLKVGKDPTLVTLTIGAYGAGGFTFANEVRLSAHQWKGGSYKMLTETKPSELPAFHVSTVIGRVVEGDFPRWNDLVPTQDPTLAGCTHLAFNPDLLAKFTAYVKAFGRDGKEAVLIMLGASSDQKPCLFTINVPGEDGARLLALQVTIRATVEW